LRDSFGLYLEDLGMAHRDTVTALQLKEFQTILNTVRSPKNRDIAVRDGFETARALFDALDDIRERLMEAFPLLEGFHKWGPKLGVWFEDDWGNSWIGCGLYKTPQASTRASRTIDLSVNFPHDPAVPITFQLDARLPKQREEQKEWPLRDWCRTGTLDEEFLFSKVRDYAKRWGVVR
jgi:hypothetical protein